MSIGIQVKRDGDITESNRLWRHPQTKQRIGSGVIHDGYLFIHNDPGIAECIELKTGKTVWEERLSGPGTTGTNWSSVMIADGHCYTMTKGGDCFVFRVSPQFELVSTNSLGEASNSSVAASNYQQRPAFPAHASASVVHRKAFMRFGSSARNPSEIHSGNPRLMLPETISRFGFGAAC